MSMELPLILMHRAAEDLVKVYPDDKDGYYEEWAREEAHRQEQEEIERRMYEEEYFRTYGN